MVAKVENPLLSSDTATVLRELLRVAKVGDSQSAIMLEACRIARENHAKGMSLVRWVIEPYEQGSVYHLGARGADLGKHGNWYSSCGRIVPGVVVEVGDMFGSSLCRRCGARNAKLSGR